MFPLSGDRAVEHDECNVLCLGARVIVTEVDPVRALDAVLRGFRVLPISRRDRTMEEKISVSGEGTSATAVSISLKPRPRWQKSAMKNA